MAAPTRIAEASDPRLDPYRRLNDVPFRRRIESEGRWFVAESREVVVRLLRSRVPTRSVVVTPPRRDSVEPHVPDHVPMFVVERAVLAEVAGFDVHRGVLAVGERPPPTAVVDLARSSSAVAMFEGLNDHENLGALFRSAAALGLSGVVLDDTCADPFYRRSVRVSMGGVFLVPHALVGGLGDACEVFRRHGFRVVALTPGEGAIDIAEVEPGPPTVVVLGAEGPGLRPETIAAADLRVRIPMTGSVDSLNVGHAGAIAFHRFSLVQ